MDNGAKVIFAEERMPWVEEQVRRYVDLYQPAYVRLLCNCLEPEKILGTLIAIAPVIGTARIISAAGSILKAFALAEDFAEEDQ